MIKSKYVKTGETKNYSIFISPSHQRDINTYLKQETEDDE